MGPNATSEQKRLRIALLHLAPVPGDLEGNRNAVVSAIERAVDAGAGWIITPELVLCGYTFIEQLGTDWIVPQPDDWMTRVCTLAARHRVTVFLSCPERDPLSGRLHNSVFIISDDGTIVGRHRKINTLPVGSEAWSSPGTNVAPIEMPGFGKVGILICADACSPEIARQLRESGARLLVSAAAWAPGLHGPNGEWERATLDTGLALVVCNRTGPDLVLDGEEDDGPEEIDSLHIDLATPVLEEFVLSLDPYPRRSGVEFGAKGLDSTPPESPFAVLKTLK